MWGRQRGQQYVGHPAAGAADPSRSSRMRPPPKEGSERVRANPQRRSCPGQWGHVSSGAPRSASAWSPVPRSRPAPSRIGPSCPTGAPEGKGGSGVASWVPDRPNASHRTVELESAQTPETCSSRRRRDGLPPPRIQTESAIVTNLTPLGAQVVIQSVALHPLAAPRRAHFGDPAAMRTRPSRFWG